METDTENVVINQDQIEVNGKEKEQLKYDYLVFRCLTHVSCIQMMTNEINDVQDDRPILSKNNIMNECK